MSRQRCRSSSCHGRSFDDARLAALPHFAALEILELVGSRERVAQVRAQADKHVAAAAPPPALGVGGVATSVVDGAPGGDRLGGRPAALRGSIVSRRTAEIS
ncbi:MAG: hypothetical protein IPL61_32955 [Myxococcales bacterium]|nr:hypothetical protein [Myxococcales bacterium]